MRVSAPHGSPQNNPDLGRLYQSVREASARLSAPLSDADATVQSMPDASPAKWHLAHTTWFFERMILEQNLPRLPRVRSRVQFPVQFVLREHRRSSAASETRHDHAPDAREVLAYRDHVDRAMASLVEDDLSPAVAALIELGCNHEQQHQELLLTDILHLFAQNPLHPAYKDPARSRSAGLTRRASYRKFDGGVVEVGPRRRRLRLRLRGSAASRAHRALRARGPAGHQCGMDGVHRRRRLSHAAPLALGRLGDGAVGRLERAALLGGRATAVIGR